MAGGCDGRSEVLWGGRCTGEAPGERTAKKGVQQGRELLWTRSLHQAWGGGPGADPCRAELG